MGPLNFQNSLASGSLNKFLLAKVLGGEAERFSISNCRKCPFWVQVNSEVSRVYGTGHCGTCYMDEDFLRTEIEINVTFLIVMLVSDLIIATHMN